MQIVAGITLPLQDEHVLATDPLMAPQLPGVWRKRLRAFTGRSLTADALTAEQDARCGLAVLRGQSVAPGVVRGLGVQVETGTPGLTDARAVLHIAPGFGLARSGEDISVQTPRRLVIADLPALVRADWLDALLPGAPAPSAVPSGHGGVNGDALPGGAFAALPPPLPRRMALRFGNVIGDALDPVLPRAAVLVAEPVIAELSGRDDPADPCPRDPRNDPYDDWQRIDGCRLVLYPWPSELVSTPVGGARPPDYALPGPGADFRNQLAWRIFGVERGFLPGEAHPWEGLGVPLALLGFNADWTLAFADRSAVVRAGGLPNPRTPAVQQAGSNFLFQARLSQFVEQLGDLGLNSVTPAVLAQAMGQLPPVGVLPASVLDVATRRQNLFPPGFSVTAVPIASEQLELALRESASLAPYLLTQPDTVELLVPVPERVYEPELLEVAQVASIFPRTVARFITERTQWLLRRELVRRRRDTLTAAVTGSAAAWRATDPDETASERLPTPKTRPPVSAAGFRRVTATGARSHRYTGAATRLTFAATDILFVWVRIAPGAAPTALALEIGLNTDPLGGGDWSHAVLWGTAAGLPAFAADSPGIRRAGNVPSPGVWTQLVWPAIAAWTAASAPVATLAANGIGFAQAGGTVEWGPFGRLSQASIGEVVYSDAGPVVPLAPGGNETIWIADDGPDGAVLIPGAGPPIETVPADPADEQVSEDDYGTQQVNAGRSASALADFRARWNLGFLADDMGDLAEAGLDGFTAALRRRLTTTNDALDLGFTRARADIYRVRQYVLGADVASRLVTSPTLADIAVRNDSARAKSDQILQFMTAAYVTTPGRDAANPLLPVPEGTAATVQGPKQRFLTPLRSGLAGETALSSVPMTLTGQMSMAAMPVSRTLNGGLVQRIDGADSAGTTNRAATTMHGSLAGQLANAGTRGSYSSGDIQSQLPLTGYAERSSSVGERLTTPPAMETYQYALEGKQTVLSSLTRLVLAPPVADAAGSTRRPGIGLADLPLTGFAYAQDTKAPPGRTLNTVGDFALHPTDYTDSDTVTGDPTKRHESDYFTAAVSAIDNAIAMMRLAEGRVDLYNRLIADALTVRADIVARVADTDPRLRAIEAQLAEARHDVATASALLAEETARIDAINARRAAVLAQYVTFLAFRRPRSVNRDTQAPISPADAAVSEDPVAACSREHPFVPAELRQMAGLFREAPVRWLPPLWPHLRLLDTADQVQRVFQTVQRRAPGVVALLRQVSPVPAAGGTKYLAAATSALAAQSMALAGSRSLGLQLNAATFAALNLTAAREQLIDAASAADLLDGWHGRGDVVRLVANEVDGIAQIAACLYASFGEVLPVIRLAWAEQLSALTAPLPLQSLTALPRWGELPAEQRREQQGMADWLFGRIHPDNAAAVAAMSDLVRVAALMASHAPVDRIVGAALSRPAPAQIGGLLHLAVDTSQLRLGMAVLVRNTADTVLAHAVVEDLGDGVARARIVQASDPSITITAAARIHLTHALPAGVPLSARV